MTKPACVYIGWLITSGVLDAFRGTSEISYPHYEWYAVRALQDLLDKAATRNLHEVVYPVVILGLFEVNETTLLALHACRVTLLKL